jgi:hypothetical protein
VQHLTEAKPSEAAMAAQRTPGIAAARSEATKAPRVSSEQTRPRSWGERICVCAATHGREEGGSCRAEHRRRHGRPAHAWRAREGARPEIREGERSPHG